MKMMVLRSMLYVPGNNMRMIHKACKLNADAVILDLEDAVPIDDKETARIFIRDSIEMLKNSGATVFVRVNSLSTGLTQEDLEYAIRKGLDGIMLPKCESSSDVIELENMISKLERNRGIESGSIAIMPLIETTRGVLNAYEIASSSKRIVAIGFGAVDFTRELGTSPSKEGIEILYARSHIAISARAANILSIDTPWTDIMDMNGLIEDAKMARRLGFNGKMLIHPKQINPINEIFTPSSEEIEFAKKIVEEFEKAQKMGLGAISIEGMMIDIANYRQAKQLLTLVKLIRERESKRR